VIPLSAFPSQPGTPRRNQRHGHLGPSDCTSLVTPAGNLPPTGSSRLQPRLVQSPFDGPISVTKRHRGHPRSGDARPIPAVRPSASSDHRPSRNVSWVRGGKPRPASLRFSKPRNLGVVRRDEPNCPGERNLIAAFIGSQCAADRRGNRGTRFRAPVLQGAACGSE
jgi:hypothetical protein